MKAIFYPIMTALIVLTSNALAISQNPHNLPILVCPDVKALQVNIMEGTATAPNGWSGQSAIPLTHKNDWQSILLNLNAEGARSYNRVKAECQYFSEYGNLIDIKKSIPSDYKLYGLSSGVEQLTNCWIHKDGLNAGEKKECYWYSHPILKRKF